MSITTSNYFFDQLGNATNVDTLFFSDLLAQYSEKNKKNVYLIHAPLGDERYTYTFDHGLVILSPKHKVTFINLGSELSDFEDYVYDFMEDLSAISIKYKYKDLIGRPRQWKDNLVTSIDSVDKASLNDGYFTNLFESIRLESSVEQRKVELLISLLTGSINNINNLILDVSDTVLDKVKQKILLFDGQQTRFIYQKTDKPVIRIQGLSGTGKTELLLHKLKDLYLNHEKSRIMFTCHNKILAHSLKHRIPEFFDFMKVEQQIQWNERLWCVNAWGGGSDVHSGAYRYICNFYNLKFRSFQKGIMDFNLACTYALKELENSEYKENFAFDYMLIDESQDFPQSFFDLCAKVTKEIIYIAGDIFQNIFSSEKAQTAPDYLLSKCYRTDPKTLMFAHGLGMGLFEESKLQWLNHEEWEMCGYNVKDVGNRIHLSRDPLRRFEDIQNIDSIELIPCKDDFTGEASRVDHTIKVIRQILKDNTTAKPHDIAVITTETNNYSFDLLSHLEYKIGKELNLEVNKAYDTRNDKPDEIFLSTRNHVKGLEFPFVICHVTKISDSRSIRNALYMILTRSFIKTYLLFSEDLNQKIYPSLVTGLETIKKEGILDVEIPSDIEINQIKASISKIATGLSLEDQIIHILRSIEVQDVHFDRILHMIKAAVSINNSYEYEYDDLYNLTIGIAKAEISRGLKN